MAQVRFTISFVGLGAMTVEKDSKTMGNLRKLKRSVENHALAVWRAKEKAKKQNENQSKQEETKNPSGDRESGNNSPTRGSGSSDSVSTGQKENP